MRIGGKIIAAAIGLTLAACQAAPSTASADASFAWGCWVAKDEPGGRIHGFLRLLKDGPDGKLYEGYLHDVRGSDMIPVLHLAIARDGSHATVVKNGETTEFTKAGPINSGLTFKSSTPGKAGALSLAQGNEMLRLTLQIGAENNTYAFERDGCD